MPTWLFYWGAAIVLVVSFVLLGVLWRTPLLAARERGRAIPSALSRIVLGPGRILAQVVSVALFVVVWLSAVFGDTDPFRNLAPTWIYVIFWLGLPALTVVFGYVWRGLSPWRAIADAFVWVREAGGRRGASRWRSTPAGSGAGPPLLRSSPSSPWSSPTPTPRAPGRWRSRSRSTATSRSSAWRPSAVTPGRRAARASPSCTATSRGSPRLHVEDGRIRVRWPLTGLVGPERVPGSVAFVAVMLGSVLFDGYSRTTTWQDLVARVEGPYIVDDPTFGELLVTLLNIGGLLTGVLLVALAYQAACAAARWTVNAPRSLTGDFLFSLVPIAFVYMVAHYFTLFVLQGQFAIPLLSDPLGRGWNLFGTAHVTPDLTVISPNTTWYVQVGALVAGHVAGLAVAHDRAITIFPARRDALRSQYALLALMVLYTVGGLWVLSRG